MDAIMDLLNNSIESIDYGQREAARSLGMTVWRCHL